MHGARVLERTVVEFEDACISVQIAMFVVQSLIHSSSAIHSHVDVFIRTRLTLRCQESRTMRFWEHWFLTLRPSWEGCFLTADCHLHNDTDVRMGDVVQIPRVSRRDVFHSVGERRGYSGGSSWAGSTPLLTQDVCCHESSRANAMSAPS